MSRPPAIESRHHEALHSTQKAKRKSLKALLLLTALFSGGFSLAAQADADIVLNHSDNPDPGPAGGEFTYTLRIDNNGPGLATGVALANTLPPGSQFVSASTTAGSCTTPAVGADGAVNCTLGDIPFTFPATRFQTVTIRVILPTAGVWTNTATATTTAIDPNPGNNTNSIQPTTVLAAADMSITATPSAATVTAGQPYNYSVVTTNNGPDALASDARQVISFTVPSGAMITAAPSGTGWTCTVAPSGGYPRISGTFTCTRTGALAVGASTPTLTVPAKLNVAGTVTAAFDVAAVKGNGDPMPDGNLTNNTTTASVTSNAGSDVSITKSASPTTVAQGANVTYTLTPGYQGGIQPGSTGSGMITVTDTLGAGLAYVSATGTGWTCDASALPSITCTRPGPWTGAIGSTMPTIAVVATAVNTGPLANNAAIAIPEVDPVPANNTAGVNVTSTDQVDLSMSKTASINPVVLGQDFSYRLRVRNNGPLAALAGDTVTVTDTLPAGMNLRALPTGTGWSCSVPGGTVYPAAGPITVTCTTTAAVNSGSNYNDITVLVEQTAAGVVNNTACNAFAGTVSGRNDGNSANDCSTAGTNGTTVGSEADLVLVSKTASPATVIAGEDLTYVISMRNDGPGDATNVVLTDTLGSLVGTGSLQSVVPTQGSCTPVAPQNNATINLSCNLGTVLNGGSASVTVVVRPSIATTGNRTNTASVFSNDVGDPDRNNNTGSVTSTVTAKVDVQVTKTANPSTVPAGATVTYVSTIRNNGPSTAATVTMTDTLPINGAFISLGAISGGGTCSTVPTAGDVGGTLVCSWPTINSGSQNTVTYSVRPLGSAAGQNLVNNVAVTTATLETFFDNNNASTSTPVTAANLDILVQKDDTVDPLDLGAITAYNIRINNGGPSYGTNLVMTDVFPDPLNSATATFSYQGGLVVSGGGVCTEPAIGATAGTLRCTWPGIYSGAGNAQTVTYNMRAESLTIVGAYSGTAYNRVTVAVDETETLSTNNEVYEDTTARRVSIATDVALTKSTPTPTVYAGVTIPYTLSVTNNGPLASDGAQVVDVLPAGVSFVSAPGCTVVGSTVTCAVGALAVGASRSFILTVQANTPYDGADPLVNTATLDALGDTDLTNNTGTASTPANPAATPTDFSLTKTTTVPAVYPGVNIPYTLTVTNNGPLASPGGAQVVDVLPAGVSFVSAPGCTEASGTVTCDVGVLAVGASRSFTLTVQASNPYTGANPLVNSADVVAIGDTVPTNNHGTASTPLDNAATPTDFALTKDTAIPVIYTGASIPYTLTVTNNGPLVSPGGAQVVDVLPAGVSFVSAPGCTEAAGTVTCDVGALAVGAQRSFTLTVLVSTPYTGANPLVNTAEVRASGDTYAPNNTGSVSRPFSAPCTPTDLGMSVSTSVTSVVAGANIPYTLSVVNNGPATSDGGTVSATLPAGVSFVSAPGCTEAGGVVSCAVGSLATGATRAFTLTVQVSNPYTGANPLVMSASVTGTCGDPVDGNNISSVSIPLAPPVCESTDMRITVSTKTQSVLPGDFIAYYLTSNNNGPAVAYDSVVTDTLPAGVAFVSAPGCTLDAGTVRCAIGDIAVGASNTVLLTVRVNNPYDGANPLVNSATVTHRCGENDPPNNTDVKSIPMGGVVPIPTLSEWMMMLLAALMLLSVMVMTNIRARRLD